MSITRRSNDRRHGTGEVWTVQRTKSESFATILAVCWHRQRYRPLTVEVGLSSTISTFRWDLSSRSLVMTQLIAQWGAREPALLIERGSPYYDRYATELRNSFEQSRLLPIEQAVKAVPLDDNPSVEQTQQLFVALHLPLPTSFDDNSISEIIHKAIQSKNPYPQHEPLLEGSRNCSPGLTHGDPPTEAAQTEQR